MTKRIMRGLFSIYKREEHMTHHTHISVTHNTTHNTPTCTAHFLDTNTTQHKSQKEKGRQVKEYTPLSIISISLHYIIAYDSVIFKLFIV